MKQLKTPEQVYLGVLQHPTEFQAQILRKKDIYLVRCFQAITFELLMLDSQ